MKAILNFSNTISYWYRLRTAITLTGAVLLATAALLGGVLYADRSGWIWLRLTGNNLTLEENLAHLQDISIQEFVSLHPEFQLTTIDPPALFLPQREYIFKQTILIPTGASLTIEPGAVLRFCAGCSLISYSPIIARGTSTQPIFFTASTKWLKWGVVGIVDSGPSIFEHTRFEHGRQAQINGIDFPGSLSFIKTDAEVNNSEFINMFGRDALYVRESHVHIYQNIFRDIDKDGLDVDSGSGQIKNNLFENCGDEGIDLSGQYQLQVSANRILGPSGGRLSAEHDLEEILLANELGYSSAEKQK